MNFKKKLLSISRDKNSLLCIGLDTDFQKLPESIKSFSNPVLEFNKRIIESTKDFVCAYKINFAFYEAMGSIGWNIIHDTLNLIPNNIITIADAKRGDIGNTSRLYAEAIFERFHFDAVTVNPLLGRDSVKPFLEYKNKGIFILTLTSNPGSKDFQHLEVDEDPLYIRIAQKIHEWNEYQNCCLVVGATHPKELNWIRKFVPTSPILIPGIGTQGGDLEATVKAGCDKNGELAIINVSRAIIFASPNEDFAEIAAKVAMDYRDRINEIRHRVG